MNFKQLKEIVRKWLSLYKEKTNSQSHKSLKI